MKYLTYPIRLVEDWIDATTMYRTVLYALGALVVISVGLGVLGSIPQTGLEQLRSLVVVLVAAFLINEMCARLWRIPTNHESVAITALIIYFLVNPAREVAALYIIVLAAGIAVVSKYLIVWRQQHVTNPAAVGILALSLTGVYESTWWIATPVMFIPLCIAGLVVVYKVRKWVPVLSFIAVAFIVFLYEEWQFFGTLNNWSVFWLSYPALFLAFFMLTEPFTMPSSKRAQAGYGALVGFLSSTAMFAPFFKMSPELALVIGNLAAQPFRLTQKLQLVFTERRKIARDTYEYVFDKPKDFYFVAGQYLEWMLPHSAADRRGVRRYFTIASSPTESDVRLGLKIMSPGSSYKAALSQFVPGDRLIASQLAGDFTLPKSAEAKIGWIAGGIGVTPFRSQVQYMIDVPETRHDTVLLYCVQHVDDLAYQDVFTTATGAFEFRCIPVVSDTSVALPPGAETGFVTADMLTRQVPDYRERTWYLSGPPRMVDAYALLLRQQGVPRHRIVCDFFPGLA